MTRVENEVGNEVGMTGRLERDTESATAVERKVRKKNIHSNSDRTLFGRIQKLFEFSLRWILIFYVSVQI